MDTTTSTNSHALTFEGLAETLKNLTPAKRSQFLCSYDFYDKQPPDHREHLTPTHAVDGDNVYEVDMDKLGSVLTPQHTEIPLVETVTVPEGALKVFPYDRIRRLIRQEEDKWVALDEAGGLVAHLSDAGVQSLRRTGGF